MCTSIKMHAANESIVFARTMDWHSFVPEALVLPQNYQWKSVYNNRNISNVYTILGVGRNIPDLHADISDGVNDFGLSVQKLTFSNHSEYAEYPHEGKLQLAPFEFVTWALGNCRSVADLINQLESVQLMSDTFSHYKFGRSDLHFSAVDPTGRMINIEPRNGSFEIIENTIGVVTNAPKFEREIVKLQDYMDLTAQPQHLTVFQLGILAESLFFLEASPQPLASSVPQFLKNVQFCLLMSSRISAKSGIF
ncbi:penicillin acylase [Lactococcus garvieae TRF1]|uniref:Penicillin acylase n=1 Tax=Lactococcus garvieae TRF1 TaxID=1380772 RepID=V8APQ1_9LACT|nr:penicillin acylase [Lactococcus garvieae TRF1]